MEREEAGNFIKLVQAIENALKAGKDWSTVSKIGAQASQEFINAKGARSGGDDSADVCPYKLEPRRNQ